MKEVTLVYPHQLFRHHPAIAANREVYLVEEWLHFKQYNFHRKKLILHRASMKAYKDFLLDKQLVVHYIDCDSPKAKTDFLLQQLFHENVHAIHVADVADNWLRKAILNHCKKMGTTCKWYVTPNFLNAMEDVKDFFDKHTRYYQTAFYIDQRKRRKLLLDPAGQPEGGHWSYDADNRLKYPVHSHPPQVTAARTTHHVTAAKSFVTTNFKDNYGGTENFIFPIDFDGAEKWLDEFLRERFMHFGSYEDALVASEHFLHHAVLTPMLNIGLLTPAQIIQKALKAAPLHGIPLNSLEGFLRQVVGWREFVRIVYEREGSKQRTRNYWGFTRKIPASFWAGTTGIAPVDNVIEKVLHTGYSHHIERLMVLGNFMLLCEFDPDEVYRWFMEMYIDAYDWVMVPNVYGMSQFADGGLMTTKPYISSSNYLLKMSDYKKGSWTATWDALFWRFMQVHRYFFMQNPRLGMLLKIWDKMPPAKQNQHLETAETFLASLDAQTTS